MQWEEDQHGNERNDNSCHTKHDIHKIASDKHIVQQSGYQLIQEPHAKERAKERAKEVASWSGGEIPAALNGLVRIANVFHHDGRVGQEDTKASVEAPNDEGDSSNACEETEESEKEFYAGSANRQQTENQGRETCEEENATKDSDVAKQGPFLLPCHFQKIQPGRLLSDVHINPMARITAPRLMMVTVTSVYATIWMNKIISHRGMWWGSKSGISSSSIIQ
jgi:hypothetical protein